jgi:hypothetical protein
MGSGSRRACAAGDWCSAQGLKSYIEFIRGATNPDTLMSALVECNVATSRYAEQSAQLLLALDEYGPDRPSY